MLLSCSMTIFTDWLEKEMHNRNMSPATLSRAMRKDQGVISRMLSGERKPRPETLSLVAHALKVPTDEVFRAAGILPPSAEEDPLVKLITYLAEQLPTEEDKQDAAEYLRLRLRIAVERGNHESNDKKRASKSRPG